VISPEGCAAILWKDGGKGKVAAESLRLTAGDLFRLGVIDEVVKEPPGGAHRNPSQMAAFLKEAIDRHFEELGKTGMEVLCQKRYERFRKIGDFFDESGPLTSIQGSREVAR
jgi:acetyl-CoA carboxylase carboxyl transferase subunit alpha